MHCSHHPYGPIALQTSSISRSFALFGHMESQPKTSQVAVEMQPVDIEKNLIGELQKLGLTLNEARMLVYIMTHGHSNAGDISRQTGIQRKVYNHLLGLLAKGIVFSTFDRPQKYYSLSLEEVVDCLLQSKRNVLEVFERRKKDYAAMFEALVSTRVIRRDDKKSYNVIMGENAINAKIARMLADAKQVMMLLTDRNMVNFYHADIMDRLLELTTKGVPVKLRTSCKNAREYTGDKSHRMPYSVIEKDIPASFVLVDEREILVILEENPTKSETCGFYTNNLALVSVFKFLFENAM